VALAALVIGYIGLALARLRHSARTAVAKRG
jgi:hypothetical protein